MSKLNYKNTSKTVQISTKSIYDTVPTEVKKWIQDLPLNRGRWVLSLYHRLTLTAPKDTPAESLETYIADILISWMLQDQVPQEMVKRHLKKFHINVELDDLELKNYIQQFYIHSAQNLRGQPNLYLELVLKLFQNKKERNNLFNYILGFEILKMIFQMSWSQHERLYRLQKHQEIFIKTYIKPIQYTHKINGIVVPKYEDIFFAKRSYYVKRPKIKEKRLIELLMATFTTDTVTNLGFLLICNLNCLVFDYDYIFDFEPKSFFISV